MAQVFISYAHANRADFEELAHSLKVLFQDLGLQRWYDADILPDMKWHAEIQEQMEASEVFIQFLSDRYLASDYIQRHEQPFIAKARESRKAIPIAVLARACQFRSRFGDRQVVPVDATGTASPLFEAHPPLAGPNVQRAIEQIRRYLMERLQLKATGAGFSVRPSADGYRIVETAPTDADRNDEDLPDFFDRLAKVVRSLRDDLFWLSNTCPTQLSDAMKRYGTCVERGVANVDVRDLWTSGIALRAQLDAFRRPGAVAAGGEPVPPGILGALEAIVRQHVAVLGAFEEGKRLLERERRGIGIGGSSLLESARAMFDAIASANGVIAPSSRPLLEAVAATIRGGSILATTIGDVAVSTAIRIVTAFAAADARLVADADKGDRRYNKLDGETRAVLERAVAVLRRASGAALALVDSDPALRDWVGAVVRRGGARRREPGDILRERPDFPLMTWIPPGSFTMGIPEGEGAKEDLPEEFAKRSRPLTDVAFKNGFWLGRFPVTVGEFRAFVRANPEHDMGSSMYTWEKRKWQERKDRNWEKPGFKQADDHPVVGVSWRDAQEYVAWLNREVGKAVYRLPSEAEWEYACRAGDPRPRWWGDDWDAAHGNAGMQHRGTTPVEKFPANPWQVRDMLGNVWEWTQDAFTDDLTGQPPDGLPKENATEKSLSRVLRGGSWNYSSRNARAGFRFRNDSGNRVNDAGFRLARTSF